MHFTFLKFHKGFHCSMEGGGGGRGEEGGGGGGGGSTIDNLCHTVEGMKQIKGVSLHGGLQENGPDFNVGRIYMVIAVRSLVIHSLGHLQWTCPYSLCRGG